MRCAPNSLAGSAGSRGRWRSGTTARSRVSARFNGGGGSGVALFPRAGLDALAEASPSSSHRIIRPFLVLSQSFAARLWCGQSREVVDNGRSRDQFGPEGPEVSTSAAWRSPAVRDQAKGQRVAGDPNLKLEARHGTDSSQTPRWREADSNHQSREAGNRRFGRMICCSR